MGVYKFTLKAAGEKNPTTYLKDYVPNLRVTNDNKFGIVVDETPLTESQITQLKPMMGWQDFDSNLFQAKPSTIESEWLPDVHQINTKYLGNETESYEELNNCVNIDLWNSGDLFDNYSYKLPASNRMTVTQEAVSFIIQ